ncbi:biotin/lipoyl-binding protein [Devosia ginsengisoli]|uniref:biotin/lipoyl-binding protein n=1 Tax=Devosia ginsengisoli TaxID=400770 RepID=UPI0026EB25A5|nr:biotin/lipoyl-binding protein [Devosia ginsengisoli]MCR6670673.1 biotin/lipoyl-binding protein [Devosia ginsengisoli]
MRAVLGKIIGYAVFAVTAVLIYLVWSSGVANPRSDVAEIEAPVVQISPTVPGRVISIAVTNNQAVKQGDVLFQIDPEPYQLRLEQAQAEQRAAEI